MILSSKWSNVKRNSGWPNVTLLVSGQRLSLLAGEQM